VICLKPIDTLRSNTFESHLRRTTPVGIFDNATPEGAYDLSGNVWNWTSSRYIPYPYQTADGREDPAETDRPRVLRGGSWLGTAGDARAAFRHGGNPDGRGRSLGFRVVWGGVPSV
jgi:formylglycine-generating enzyme required for sulfatase activity